MSFSQGLHCIYSTQYFRMNLLSEQYSPVYNHDSYFPFKPLPCSRETRVLPSTTDCSMSKQTYNGGFKGHIIG